MHVIIILSLRKKRSEARERPSGRGSYSNGAHFLFANMCFSHVGFQVSWSPSHPQLQNLEITGEPRGSSAEAMRKHAWPQQG